PWRHARHPIRNPRVCLPRDAAEASAEHLANAIEETLVDGRDFFAAVASVFLQQLALPSRKLPRDVDVDAYQLVTPCVPLKIRDALASQTKHCARLGAGGNLQLGLVFERRNFDLTAERDLRERHRQFADDVFALARKQGVLCD